VNVNGDARRLLLESLGRFYGEQRFAVIFTETNRVDRLGKDPKRVSTKAWQHTKPLAHAAAGAALLTHEGVGRNPAITARTSNLILIDCDTPEGLAEIAALGLPETLTARSSAEYKRHFYFRPPAGLERVEKVGFRFEAAGVSADENRYLVCPPALHPDGFVYEFLPGLGPGEVEIAELPLDIYRALLERAGADRVAEREAVRRDPAAKFRQGSRGAAIFRYACQQRRWTADHDEILELALLYNERHCDPPISRERVELQVNGAMRKTGEQELPSAPRAESADALGDVLSAVRRYLDVAEGEEDFLVAALAVSVSKALTYEEPLWLILVGASGGGKTEAIKLLAAIAEGRVDELTRAGLLSWAPGKRARRVGLLTRIPPSSLVTISDFSTVVTMGDREARARMFGMLRVVYDGRVYRSIGGQPAGEGDELAWEGHLTLIAGATPVIDTHTSFEGALGERWIMLRLSESDEKRARERARFVMRREDASELRDAAQVAAHDLVLAARERIPARLSEATEERLVDASVFVAHARTGVVYEGQGKYRVIVGIPTPEEPTRLVGQLARLARCAVALGLTEDEALRLAIKAALDSVPLARFRALRAVADHPVGATVSDVQRALGRGNWWAAKWELDALTTIGIATETRAEINGVEQTIYALDPRYGGLYESVAFSCTPPSNKREDTGSGLHIRRASSPHRNQESDDGIPF
jgi:hypothetical protein